MSKQYDDEYFKKESERMHALMQQCNKDWAERKVKQEREWEEEIERRRERGEQFIEHEPPPKQRCDHPNTMEDSTATLLWIIVMVVGTIFKGNWIIWIIATAIWLKFITRYKN